MRRAADAGPGTVEFLIATAALTFQAEGAEWVSLSGAPLALPPGRADGGRADPAAGAGRAHHGAGLRLPLAAGVQGQVPAAATGRCGWCTRARPTCPGSPAPSSRAYLPHVSLGQAARLAGALLGVRTGGRSTAGRGRTKAGRASDRRVERRAAPPARGRRTDQGRDAEPAGHSTR